ncbi:MAG: SHD1 domain-containing protein, partial [Verrucomicrobia bacterium]|nr:SHD1 domain-containing protein [Verrucomicrobiota bacterium]
MKTTSLSICLTFLMIGPGLAQNSASVRTWTSNDGKALQATFVSLQGDQVEIAMANGSVFKLPLSRFSTTDQKYAQDQAAKATPTA